MKHIFICLLFFVYYVLGQYEVSCLFKKNLINNWTVRNKNESISIPATVPGGIYSDLSNATILNDIYYRFNDINYRWVANETWIYQSNFIVAERRPTSEYINLVFEGLDTYSIIYLNDVIIGESSNMFVKYVFNITSYIKENNNLTIVFLSPITISINLYTKQAAYYIVPPKCVPHYYNGECHANFIRKMQASFSWDWGPAFPSVGIWYELLNTKCSRT